MQSRSTIVRLRNGYNVWTRHTGDEPVHMLLLHGGPGFTHEYFEGFDERQGDLGVTVHFYDQLGSHHSDQPDDPSLWTMARFREEVEEVRRALDLDRFYLFGQSWGGWLALEYAVKYRKHLKGLILSSSTASLAAYEQHLGELRGRLPADVLQTLERYESSHDYEAPEYQKLLWMHLYRRHLCRTDPWPEPVLRGMNHMNEQVYATMQGPNEFVVNGNLKDWDRWDDLPDIDVPTLLSVGEYDTMPPRHIEAMGRRMPDARVQVIENAGHMAMWDNPDAYFDGIAGFVRDVEN